eukprot:6090428-Pleurochrysis_carterae.AAC.1
MRRPRTAVVGSASCNHPWPQTEPTTDADAPAELLRPPRRPVIPRDTTTAQPRTDILRGACRRR